MTIILDNEDFEWLKVLANHVPDEEEDAIMVEQLGEIMIYHHTPPPKPTPTPIVKPTTTPLPTPPIVNPKPITPPVERRTPYDPRF